MRLLTIAKPCKHMISQSCKSRIPYSCEIFSFSRIIFASGVPRFVLTNRQIRTVKHAQFTDQINSQRTRKETARQTCQCEVKSAIISAQCTEASSSRIVNKPGQWRALPTTSHRAMMPKLVTLVIRALVKQTTVVALHEGGCCNCHFRLV